MERVPNYAGGRYDVRELFSRYAPTQRLPMKKLLELASKQIEMLSMVRAQFYSSFLNELGKFAKFYFLHYIPKPELKMFLIKI